MPFCIYRLAKRKAGGRGLGELLAQTITLAERARTRQPKKAPADSAEPKKAKPKELHSLGPNFSWDLQGPEKLEKCFLFARFELFKFLGDLLGFAFVATNGIEQRDRDTVVHQARVQAHTP